MHIGVTHFSGKNLFAMTQPCEAHIMLCLPVWFHEKAKWNHDVSLSLACRLGRCFCFAEVSTGHPSPSLDHIRGTTGVHSYTADSKVYYFLKWCIPFNKMLNYGCMICGILTIASAVYCVIALLNKDKTTIHQIYYIITPHLLKICIPFCASLNLGCIFYNIMRLECIRSAIRLRTKPLN